MKTKFLAAAAAVFTLAFAYPANADLILVGPTNQPVATVAESFVDVGAQGFGDFHRILTLQTNTVETGSVIPVNMPQGDAVPGANKANTPTLSQLGWTSGSNVGIGFNADTTGGATSLSMQSLVLTIFNGNTSVGSFSLSPSLTPLTFTAADLALQQGNGNAVFDFGLNAAQQAQFNTIVAEAGSSGFRMGLASQLGCPAGAPTPCFPSNDGPDSFVAFAQPASVPGPIVGAGIPGLIAGCIGLVGLARRRIFRRS